MGWALPGSGHLGTRLGLGRGWEPLKGSFALWGASKFAIQEIETVFIEWNDVS